jgi:hypothetical protein
MRRPFFALALALLLLGFQHLALTHAYAHRGTHHEDGARTTDRAEACLACELLASGADGIPASSVASCLSPAPMGVSSVAFATRAVAAPAFYASRAPPPAS